MKFENTIEIQVPVAQVFRFVATMENTPRWNYYVNSVQQTAGEGPQRGAQYHQVRKSDAQDYRITQYDPDRSLRVETLPGSTPAFERQMDFETVVGGTRITDRWKLSTDYPSLLESLAAGRIRSAVSENLGKLKELLEEGQTRLQDGQLQPVRLALPAVPVDHIVKRPPPIFLRRTRDLGFCGIAHRDKHRRTPFWRDAQMLADIVWLIDCRQAGADAKVGGGNLKISGALAQVEIMEARLLVLRWNEQDDNQRGPGSMPGRAPADRELVAQVGITHGEKVPGLAVEPALRPPPGVQDFVDMGCGQRRILKLTHGVSRANGLKCIHEVSLAEQVLPAVPVDHIVQWPPPFFPRWTRLLRLGITEGDQQAGLPFRRESQQVTDGIGLVDGPQAGADADFQGGKLHIRRALTNIEEIEDRALILRRDQDDHAQRRPGYMLQVIASRRNLAQQVAIPDSDEVPGLAVL